ncbi:MAG: hypothetical protein KDA71_08895 [Planctomycetales bacterium]|nr:hypothetical protein [Planctomycetales bacterium]
MTESNPYQPPSDEGIIRSGRGFVDLVLRVICAYGLFTNLWYAGAIALYFLVHGDNSSTIGLYAAIPSAVISIVTIWTLWNANRVWYVVAILTAPFSLLFTYGLLRYGL